MLLLLLLLLLLLPLLLLMMMALLGNKLTLFLLSTANKERKCSCTSSAEVVFVPAGVRQQLEVRAEGQQRAVEAMQVRAQGLDRFRRKRGRVSSRTSGINSS